jgi:hypothetical protein
LELRKKSESMLSMAEEEKKSYNKDAYDESIIIQQFIEAVEAF